LNDDLKLFVPGTSRFTVDFDEHTDLSAYVDIACTSLGWSRGLILSAAASPFGAGNRWLLNTSLFSVSAFGSRDAAPVFSSVFDKLT